MITHPFSSLRQPFLGYAICLLLFIVSVLSCNRDSNELAPSKYEDDRKISDVILLNGVATVRVTFIRKTDEWQNVTDMLIENLTAQHINKLGFYVQVCRGMANYDKCDYITSYSLTTGDTLKAGKVKSVRLNGDYFFGDKYAISTFLTALNEKAFAPARADFYAASAITFRDPSGQKPLFGIGKSYIQLDGRTDFFIASIDGQATHYHNMNGLITSAGLFAGIMQIDGANTNIGLSGNVTNLTKLVLKPSSKDALTYNISSIEIDLK